MNHGNFQFRIRVRYVLLLVSTAVWAQSLQILSSPPAQRGEGSFQIMMVSPVGKEPAALQWKISVPEGVTVAIADVTAGDAAKTAEKVLTCAHVKQATAGATVACILAGGQKPISDGSIAMVKVTMRAGLSSATVRIREALGVSANLKSTKIPDAEGTISVK